MDVGRAFTYVTEDPAWVKKVLVGGAIMLASILLSIVLIGLIGYFLLFGYYLEVVRRVHAGVPVPLPEWDDLGGYISRGLVAMVGAVMWTLPFIAIGSCALIIGLAMNSDAGTGTIVAGLCLAVPLLILWSIFVLPIVMARYAVTGEFGAMFQFGPIFDEMRRGLVPLMITWVVYLVVSFIAQLGIIACFIGVAFTSHYAYLVYAYLVGDMYRQARGEVQQPQSAF